MTGATPGPGGSFEDILAAVEADESLRAAPGEGSAAPSGGTGGEEVGGLGGLGGLLARPELIAKLPALLKAVKALSEPVAPGETRRPETPEALLCALRPYLGESRRQAVDTMIRLSKLSESLRMLK